MVRICSLFSLLIVFLFFIFWGLFSDGRIGGDFFLAESGSGYRSIESKGERGIYTVVDQQVVGYRRLGDHIFVRRMIAISYECTDAEGQRKIITHRTSVEEYWVIDINLGKRMGPFSEAGFHEITEGIGFGSVMIDNNVSYRPNDSGFEGRSSGCIELKQISWGAGMASPHVR